MAHAIPLPLSSHAKPVDSFREAAALEIALKQVVRGEVRFDRGSRALYANDGSNYRQVPIGLVVPRDADDVAAALAACRRYGAPVLPRGAGTSLAGQCCNVAVVLDFTKYMNHILDLDAGARRARVQPGVVLDTLRGQAERHRLTFGPDPSTHNRCSLGGMIGNNSCGTHSLLAGKTVDNVEALRVLLYDGTELTVGPTSEEELDAIVRRGGRRGALYGALRAIRDRYADLIRARFPDIPRRVSGYNLEQLLPEHGFHVARALVGTEGTCAIVLDATVRLIPSPQHRSLVALGYADAYAAADHVPEILEHGPIGLEGFEGAIIDGLRRKGAPNLELMPDGRGFLLVEFGADDPADATRQARELVARLRGMPDPPYTRVYTPTEAKAVWKIRESGPRAAGGGPGAVPRWEGWDDAAVAPEKLGAYLRDLRRLLDEYGYEAAYYGHFGHGCVHMQISFNLESEAGIRAYGEFVERAADLVVRYGGSLSGEHGDGQSRGALLPKMFGPELMQAFRAFKEAWDPDHKMNPEKGAVDPRPPTEDLRLGADYRAPHTATRFAFPDDGGSFAAASLRCIGVGECRKQDSGTMCPSYMATLEEEHSTRGRAHLLFEMLQGEVLKGGWQDKAVKHSLDLCLSCKACKSECPTNVDIPTYRAEFLSHYYDDHRRPLGAHLFGRIDRWARLGSLAPRLANRCATAPGFARLLRRAARLAPERELPPLAAVTLLNWARTHGVATLGRRDNLRTGSAADRRVVLFADTFNNYFRPRVGRAAVDVLQAAGFTVHIPGTHICCGRPLYDFGFLDLATTYLRSVIDALRPALDAGVPIVVLEPSCASVFRDELHGLLPTDAGANQLRQQVFLLSEFLEQRAPDFRPPRLPSRVLLHGHCHHRALTKMSDAEALLRRMGADLQSLDAGCCGMAGSFGFMRDTFGLSQAIGERVLLPAVRQADPGTVIVSDGFSCHEQIRQATGRRAVHMAEALQAALHRDGGRLTGE